MRRGLAWGAGGLLAYLAWLLWLAPVAPFLAPLSEAGVQLMAPQGRLWSGEAAAVQVGELRLSRLSWRWQPTALFLGRMQFELSIQDPRAVLLGEAAVSLAGDPSVRALSGQLEAGMLAPLLPLPVQLKGQLVLDDAGLRLEDRRPVSASGLVRWVQAALVQPLPLELGQIEAQLYDAEPGIRGDLSGQGPQLDLSGWATLSGEGEYVLELDFVPRNAEMKRWIASIGEPLPDGRYRFRYEDRL